VFQTLTIPCPSPFDDSLVFSQALTPLLRAFVVCCKPPPDPITASMMEDRGDVRAAAEVGAFGGTDASTTTDAPIATGAPTVTAPTMTAAGGNADDATMDLDPQASSGAAASTKDADRGGDEHGRKKRRMSDGDDGHSFAAAEAPAAPASTSDSNSAL